MYSIFVCFYVTKSMKTYEVSFQLSAWTQSHAFHKLMKSLLSCTTLNNIERSTKSIYNTVIPFCVLDQIPLLASVWPFFCDATKKIYFNDMKTFVMYNEVELWFLLECEAMCTMVNFSCLYLM